MNLSNIVILNIENVDYYSIITGISKREAIKLLQNIELTEKSSVIKIKSSFDATNLLGIPI